VIELGLGGHAFLLDHPSRDSDDRTVIGYILENDGTRTDTDVVADGDVSKD